MDNSAKIIDRFLRRATLWVGGVCFLKGLVRAVPVILGGLVLLSVLDAGIGLTSLGLKSLWLVVFVTALFFFLSAFFPLRIFTVSKKSQSLAQSDPRFREDDLYIARQFEAIPKIGQSDILAREFSENVASKLQATQSFLCAPHWNWKPHVMMNVGFLLFTSVLYALAPTPWRPGAGVFFPFGGSDLSQILRIEPGDALVPYGEETKIQLHVLVKTMQRPVLLLRIGSTWQEMSPTEESGALSTYVIKNIVEPVVYRVAWKKDFSRKYVLTPAPPVQLTDFSIVLTPPEYVQKEPTKQTAPEITALPGTFVVLDVWSNTAVLDPKMRFADGTEISAKNTVGLRRSFEFIVEKETTYTLGTPGSYPIHVVADAPPQLTLLSPEEDLIVGEKEKIPITYEARDDFGLGKIQLRWEKNGRVQNPILVEQFRSQKETVLGTYVWDMGRFAFESGDQIRYQLEVLDSNTVTGPGQASSPWRILEIAGFDREHAAIEAALEDWREKAIDLLAKVNTIQNRTEKETPDWNTLSNEFNAAAQFSEQIEAYLDRIVSKMENDPLADYGVWLEHKAMSDNMRAMNESTVKKAQSALQTQNKDGAINQMESMASELERMLALSDDLSKAQKARDVLESGERLEELAQELIKDLESGKIDAETKSKIDDLMKEAYENLAKMAQALQQMPESLPEDFVNQDALKDLKMGETKDIMSQIQDAIKRGDAQAAMSLAQSFLKATQQMQKSLSAAHESFLESRSASDLQKKMEDQQKALSEVIEEQAEVLSETQKLESKRWESRLHEQNKLLDELAKRQANVVAMARSVPILGGQVPAMEAIHQELQRKQIDRSPEWLQEILVMLGPVTVEMVRSSAPTVQIQSVGKIREEETYILDRLSKPTESSYTFSKEDIQKFSDLQKRQSQLQAKTQGIKKELQTLSRKTASLSTELMQSLNSAGMEMNKASENLGRNDSRSAQSQEEMALSHLLSGRSQLQQAQAGMADMAMQQGEGGSSGGSQIRAVPRPSGQAGQGQQRTGRVRLPKSDEYRPPKEFREDLLEALKEKYPKIYEDIIHKYYKRLVE